MQHPITLLVYFVVFFALAFVWRTWLVYLRTGIRPLVLPRSDDAQGYVGRAFKCLILGLACYVLSLTMSPTAFAALGCLALDVHPVVRLLGWAMLLAALAVVGLAQRDLGDAWRIGFDDQAVPQLVQNGIYSRSRNPIFLGMRMALLGLLCISPDAVSLLMAMLGEVLMQVQVRLEEAYLQRHCGQAYARYRARVARWL